MIYLVQLKKSPSPPNTSSKLTFLANSPNYQPYSLGHVSRSLENTKWFIEREARFNINQQRRKRVNLAADNRSHNTETVKWCTKNTTSHKKNYTYTANIMRSAALEFHTYRPRNVLHLCWAKLTTRCQDRPSVHGEILLNPEFRTNSRGMYPYFVDTPTSLKYSVG